MRSNRGGSRLRNATIYKAASDVGSKARRNFTNSGISLSPLRNRVDRKVLILFSLKTVTYDIPLIVDAKRYAIGTLVCRISSDLIASPDPRPRAP
jgi:hypothetical protein